MVVISATTPASPYINTGLVEDVATRYQSSGGRLRQVVETYGAFGILLEEGQLVLGHPDVQL